MLAFERLSSHNEDIVKFWCGGEAPIFENFLKIFDFVFGNVCTFSD